MDGTVVLFYVLLDAYQHFLDASSLVLVSDTILGYLETVSRVEETGYRLTISRNKPHTVGGMKNATGLKSLNLQFLH